MKKTLTKIITLAIALAVGLIAPLTTANVYAEEDKPDVWLQISPVANRVTLNPSDEQPFTLHVDNIGGKKFKFRVYATPYSIANEAYEVNFTTETNRTQISRWVSFNQNSGAEKDSEKDWKSEAIFELEPGQRKDIEYKIAVPADIPEGGQYATIFAESIPEDNVSSTGVRAISRVGLILYGSTNGNTVETAEISNLSTKTFLTNGRISSEVDIKNTGNTDFNATVSMKIDKLIGGTVAEFSTPYPVIPDSPTRHAVTDWEDTPVFGIFRVKTTVVAADKTVEEEKIVLVLPVWIIVIMLVLLTIIIAWLIILIRKRHAQKSRLIV
ncbi:hypothetical protein J6W91_01020 [Candidatus Saccharibacteria bacterium]|nr:hypothetical protein [Candidatus Saccharibacteria bacterium]